MPDAKLSPPDRQRPRSRWFQYSLRTLLVFMTIVAVWLGWWSYRARQQRQAVAAVKSVGGRIDYNLEMPGFNGRRTWPSWLIKAIGEDHLANVQTVVLTDRKFTDAGLEQLPRLTKLERLYLGRTKVTDAGLQHLKGLDNLKRLELWSTPVTDAGLEHLTGLSELRVLGLDDTKITDAGLEHLKELTKLELLNLRTTRVTHAGVQRLQKALPKCMIEH